MENEPIDVTLVVTEIFESFGVPYLIDGPLASRLYGMVRTTQDSDIIAEMHLEHTEPFVLALEADFYVDQEIIAESIQRNSSFNIILPDTMFKVNVCIPGPRPFLQSQLACARRQTFNFGKGGQRKIRQPRRYHPLKIRMVSHGWRGIRPSMAGHSWSVEDEGRGY